MDVIAEKENKVAGKYKHFKGDYYDLYCVAKDLAGNKYVLYQQCYGDESFWLRPYEMFFGQVQLETGAVVTRFQQTTDKRKTTENKIKKLIQLIREQRLVIHYSESNVEYVITDIAEDRDYVIVQRAYKDRLSGYLTDYQLINRLGYNACSINGALNHHLSCPAQMNGNADL